MYDILRLAMYTLLVCCAVFLVGRSAVTLLEFAIGWAIDWGVERLTGRPARPTPRGPRLVKPAPKSAKSDRGDRE